MPPRGAPASDTLVQAVYLSHDRMSPEALETLVADARVRNAQDGITGALLFGGGHFVQVLEGPAPAVEALLRRIEADPRHEGFEVLLRRPTPARQFADWHMALVGLDGAEEWLDSLRGDRSLERLDRLVAHVERRVRGG